MLEYINNPDVAILNFLADGYAPKTCSQWGANGHVDFPIILDDLDESTYTHTISEWFGITDQSPRHVFIDHEFRFHALSNTKNEVEGIIEEMLDTMNGE